MRIKKRLALGVRHWRDHVPLIEVLQRYTRSDLADDGVAGVIVGLVTIPQAVAYAHLAGLPATAGLYACLLPMLIYAFLGSARHLVVGPVAIAALLVATALSDHAPRYGNDYLAITSVISIQVAILLLLLRLFRMGGLVNLLSHPVITGFINAAVLLIILSQLPSLLGLAPISTASPGLAFSALWGELMYTNLAVLGLGLGSLAFLALIPTLLGRILTLALNQDTSKHPITRTGPMLLTMGAIVGGMAIDLTDHFALVGPVTSGLPALHFPVLNLALWLDLLPSAAIIALVTYIEGFSIGTALASRHREKINANQELIALSAANLGASVSGAYPVAGSFSRSSLNVSAGARTPVSSLICAGVIVITLLWWTDLLALLPKTVLAAIVIMSVIRLLDFNNWRHSLRFYPQDAWVEWATFLAVLALGVEIGLAAGVIVSIAFFIRSSSRPVITRVGQLPGGEHFRSAKRHRVEIHHDLMALRIDENIYFANAAQIEAKLLRRALSGRGIRHLLLVCSSVNQIDSTGFAMLLRLNENLKKADVSLSLSDVKGHMMQRIDDANLANQLTGNIYLTASAAVRVLTSSPATSR